MEFKFQLITPLTFNIKRGVFIVGETIVARLLTGTRKFYYGTYEIIDDSYYRTAQKDSTSNRLSFEIFRICGNYFRGTSYTCYPNYSVKLGEDMFVPSLAVIEDLSKDKGMYLEGCPDLIFDVWNKYSPQEERDYKVKEYKYLGVGEIWEIDSDTSEIIVHSKISNINYKRNCYKFSNTVKSKIFDGLNINLSGVNLNNK